MKMQTNSNIVVVHGKRRMFRFGKKSKKTAMSVAVTLVICAVAGGVAYVYLSKHHRDNTTKANQEMTMANQSLIKGDRSQALADARRALNDSPEDMNSILTVAALTEKDNPIEAKKLYAQALDIFKQQYNPDVSGKSAATYWAAAGLAEQAGDIDQARVYYQKVVSAADPSNSYQQSLVTQSQAAIKRLR